MAAGTILRSRFTGTMACGWLTAVLAALAIMIDRDVTPGEGAAAPASYPRDVLAPAAVDRPTLVMFAHPRCPCTLASLNELREILHTCPDVAKVFVYFRTPAAPSPDWTQTALWQEAATLPGTTLVADTDGAAARRCGVATSGQVLLYGRHGDLLFSGGITAARGHVGESPGRSTVVAILSGTAETGRPTATFGCPLFDRKACGKEEACCPP